MGQIISGIGGLVSAGGTIWSGYAEQEQAQKEAYAAIVQAQQESDYLKQQAAAANQQAGYEQLMAEEEANKRSRLLAQDVGSAYANWAGNGLSVSGGTGDTFGNILKTTAAEAVADINTIRDNGAAKVWSYQNEASLLTTKAKNTMTSAYMTADSIRNRGDMAATAGVIGGIGQALGGTGQIVSGSGSGYGTWNSAFGK